ncbi:hypothetical protein B0G69_1135 [Paraburkholderia sp. RAU2J]|nr:hypothetical protein B0G69_1135 [Paraburkholderia sp. RAU2J]
MKYLPQTLKRKDLSRVDRPPPGGPSTRLVMHLAPSRAWLFIRYVGLLRAGFGRHGAA